MGFTPYCCGRCWKYQLLGRARESCPYLQPRVQVMGNPMALQGMNQNRGGGSLYIFTSAREHQCWRLQATTARGWGPSFRGITPQHGAVWRAISHLTWWLYSCHQAGDSAGEEEEIELHRQKSTPRFAKFCWWRQQSLHSFLVPGTCCWTNKT